ncbi:glycosyltransferase family 2 protein [Mucilaginibacter sp. E4BP6]|uniref:glycosyltransferase family 2 protein n=1 Tax=Mucilaginibacter sp. E4BP6 TaxID=2723089 RepID=UPI0015C8EC6B|nr:glycosyltransferase family A protein [Mucilaginibacter sp. E4BP6]NYE67575.1 glycosyltransferase involved in cell wall biosynthesis [Mucilaginibacter sp. E4BP6]
MQPAISIIVPCYNQAEYLPETLTSVLAQTVADWECIIVNDGSTDDTEAVAKEWTAKDERFKYIHQQNRGLSEARNKGIESAKGEYILPLDSDDLIGKEYIDKALNAYSNNKNIKLVYCLANKFGAENKFWDLTPYTYQNLLINNCIFCSAVYRKTSWQQIGGYNTDFKKGYEDWDFWLRMLDKNSEVYQIPDILFFYRIRPKSMLVTMQDADIENARSIIFNRIPEQYQRHFGTYIKHLYENQLLKEQIEKIYNSNSYKYGNILIKPFTYLKKLFKPK